MTDGGEEIAPGLVIPVPLRLGGLQLLQHVVECGRRGSDLVVADHPGADAALTGADPPRGRGHLFEVAGHRPRHGDGEHQAQCKGESEHHPQQLEVVRGQEHEAPREADADCHHENDGSGEHTNGAPQRGGASRPPREPPGHESGEQGRGNEDDRELLAVGPAGLHDDLSGHIGNEGCRKKESCGSHGSNL